MRAPARSLRFIWHARSRPNRQWLRGGPPVFVLIAGDTSVRHRPSPRLLAVDRIARGDLTNRRQSNDPRPRSPLHGWNPRDRAHHRLCAEHDYRASGSKELQLQFSRLDGPTATAIPVGVRYAASVESWVAEVAVSVTRRECCCSAARRCSRGHRTLLRCAPRWGSRRAVDRAVEGARSRWRSERARLSGAASGIFRCGQIGGERRRLLAGSFSSGNR